MNPRELQNQLDSLKRDFQKMQSDYERMMTELKKEVSQLNRVLESHTHDGTDGSSYIYNSGIKLKPQQQFQTGNAAFGELTEGSTMLGIILVGGDEDAGDGIQNAQLTLSYIRDGTDAFFYGFNPPLFEGIGSVSASGTTLTTNDYEWDVDELAGAQLQVTWSDTTTQDFLIDSNTKDTITVGGSDVFDRSDSQVEFLVFKPMYLGAANYMWQRAYVNGGNTGGLRFGRGETGNTSHQNGLLYMDSDGRCKFRRPNGTVDTI